MPDLYTIICEYAGGTYIAQVNAKSPRGAMLHWLQNGKIPEVLSKEKKELIENLKNDSPIEIEGCQNVSCYSGAGSKGLVLMNLVRTVRRPSR